jgi:hypothetical protein
MQAIQTRYYGRPGNVRGARIKATVAAGSITVPYDQALAVAANHAAAAKALRDKLGWDERAMIGGSLPDGSYAFVFVHRDAIVPYGSSVGGERNLELR